MADLKDLINEVKESNKQMSLSRKENTISPAAQEEQAKDARSAMTDNFQKFLGAGSFLGKGFGKLSDGISNLIPGGGVKGILGTLGTLAVLGSLVAFLRSETWQDLKERIIPALARGLETFNRVFTEFVNDLIALFVDPSLENLKELFTGDSSKFILGLAAVTVLLKPLTSFKLLKLAVTGLVSAFGAISTGLTSLGTIFGVSGAAAAGTLLAIVGGVVLIGKGLYDSFMVFSDTFKETGSVLESLKEAAIEFVGTIVGLPFDLLKDFTSYLSRKLGFEGFADTLDSFSVEDIVKDAYRGFLANIGKLGDLFINAFTPSPEFLERLSEMNPINAVKKLVPLVKKAFTPSSEFLERLTALNPFPAIKEGIDKIFNFFDSLRENISNFSPFKTVREFFNNLPEIVSFDSIREKISNFNPFGEIKDFLKNPPQLPSFSDIRESLSNFGKLIKDKFTFKVSDLKLPEIPDFGALFTNVIRKILSPIVNFTLPGLFGVGETQPLRFALGKMGSLGAGVLDFVDQAGSYKPVATSAPTRPAGLVTPTTAGEAGRGGTIFAPVVNSTSNNTSNTTSMLRAIERNRFEASIANVY